MKSANFFRSFPPTLKYLKFPPFGCLTPSRFCFVCKTTLIIGSHLLTTPTLPLSTFPVRNRPVRQGSPDFDRHVFFPALPLAYLFLRLVKFRCPSLITGPRSLTSSPQKKNIMGLSLGSIFSRPRNFLSFLVCHLGGKKFSEVPKVISGSWL